MRSSVFYRRNRSRSAQAISIPFKILKFHYKQSKLFQFLFRSNNSNSNFIMTICMRFCARLGRNSQNIYSGEKCFERRLQSRIRPLYYTQHTFPVSLTVFEIIKQKGSYEANYVNVNCTFNHQQQSYDHTRTLPKPLNVDND